MDEIKIRFHELLSHKEIQENRRISYREASRQIQIPVASVSAWDKSDVTQYKKDVLERICAYFGCRVCDLLDDRGGDAEVAVLSVVVLEDLCRRAGVEIEEILKQ